MSRQRGRIVLVGVTGLELSRADFYEKELTFQVSCSYGPGRYDSGYEIAGHDYPFGLVRWTEQRNFEAVLDLMASGAVKRGCVDYAPVRAGRSALGIRPAGRFAGPCCWSDPAAEQETPAARSVSTGSAMSCRSHKPRVAFIGAGNYGGPGSDPRICQGRRGPGVRGQCERHLGSAPCEEGRNREGPRPTRPRRCRIPRWIALSSRPGTTTTPGAFWTQWRQASMSLSRSRCV